MGNNWKTSINEIIEIFRGTLVAIVPWVEKAKIKWNKDSYDDWDNIAQAIFKNIVCSSIEGEVLVEYSLTKYDFQYKDYSDLDYIKVKCKNHLGKDLAFVSFQSEFTPMDKIKVAVLDSAEKVTEFLDIDISNIEYLLVKNYDNKRTYIKTIDVVI